MYVWAIPVVHAVTATMRGLSDEVASLTASAFSLLQLQLLALLHQGCDP